MIKKMLLFIIRTYQYFFRPWLGSRCRFSPSCSDYMQEALHNHGVFYGLYLGLWRIVRCAPWSSGGFDPVPKNHKKDL